MSSTVPAVRPRGLVQIAHYPPGSSYGPHLLRDFEFVWVLRGAARWRLWEEGTPQTFRETALEPGTLALARPGTTHHYEWDDRHASSHAYIHFEADHDPSPTAAMHSPTRTMAEHEPLGALCGYLLDLSSWGGQAERARSDQILALLLDLFLTGPFPAVDAGRRVPEPLLPALELVRQVWESSGVRPMPVPELAAAAGMSPAHFSRSFSKAFGCGPASALELIRLGRAAITLQRSNLSLSDIAGFHGFADAYHFSKRFAVAYQLPPGRFRRRGERVDPLGPLAARGVLTLWAILAEVGPVEPRRTAHQLAGNGEPRLT